MDRDYIITFDENGEPYIAHALGSRLSGAASNARRAGSRYLMKIQTKYGNRYFYTPQEVQAYQRAKSGVKKAANSAKSAVNNTKKQVNQAVKTLKSDLKKRRTWKNAEKEAASPLKDVKQIDKGWYQGRIETAAESTYDKKYAEATKKTYNKTKLGKAENAVKSASDRVKEEFRKKANEAADKVKDKAGVDEKERYEEAQKAYDENDLNAKNLDAELSSKNISLQYYDSAMLKKYGKDYKSKMSKAEKEKYSKLDAERAALWEKYWNALINKYGAATGNDPTLKDQLDKAKAEYDNTLLGKLDRRKKK